jgi:HSP20 family protein
MAHSSLSRRSEWWPGRLLADWFDWPSRTAWTEGEGMLRLEEYREEDTLVIRAEIPGIDPDKDVSISVRDRTLEIRAERREEETKRDKGIRRSEFRYGSFFRAVTLPEGAKEGDVKATYKDGILEVRVPCAPAFEAEARKVTVERG